MNFMSHGVAHHRCRESRCLTVWGCVQVCAGATRPACFQALSARKLG